MKTYIRRRRVIFSFFPSALEFAMFHFLALFLPAETAPIRRLSLYFLGERTIWTRHRWRYSRVRRPRTVSSPNPPESRLWKGKALTFRFCGIRSNVYKSSHYWRDENAADLVPFPPLVSFLPLLFLLDVCVRRERAGERKPDVYLPYWIGINVDRCVLV